MTASIVGAGNYILGTSVLSDAEIDEFLKDPIGYGSFDWSNPIELEEFIVSHRFHGLYISCLT